ncbi:MAG TPA: HEAT repeat domain-containing protein [Thermoanaerobaculia bacterium]|nr:HEAT repeat domain-containing protein [Thermoanaerobaculia bacterium]
MMRRALAICIVLAAIHSGAARAHSGEDDLVKDYAKTLAKDRDAKERARAAHWLGGRKQPEAVAALAKALSDPDASVRQAAASALWDTGKDAVAAKPELEKALDDPVAAVVARAAGALAVMGVPDKELAPAWRRALEGSRDDATAFVAARGLIGIDPPEKLAPPILTYLSKNAEEAENPKRTGSNFDDKKSAEAAAKALRELLNENAAPLLPLMDRTMQRSPESCRYILDALAGVKKLPPGTVDLALKYTHSPEPETRYAAIGLAGKVTAEREAARWIPEAIRLLGDRDESVRNEACWALKGVKGLSWEAAPELARLVASDPSMGVRKSAASALEEIGNVANPAPKAAKISVASAAKGPLAAAMKSKDGDLALAAVAAYNVLYIDTAEVVATLADVAVSGADVPARQRALQCLRNRQGQSRGVVETIRPLTKSPDALIADDAKTAIEWIDRGGAGSPGPIKGGVAAAAPASAAPAPARGAAAEASAAPVAEGAGKGSEERGLAALRERKLAFDEPSFYRALSEADTEAIRAYLDGGMSVNLVFVDSNRRTPLMIVFFGMEACGTPEKGHEITALLIKRGADVNQKDEKQNTALMFAADKCDRETLRMLLKAGAKLDAKNWAGLTALQMGIGTGNPGLEELIAAGARLDPATAKAYAEAFKRNPKAVALVKKASAP